MNIRHYVRPHRLPEPSNRIFTGALEPINVGDPEAPTRIVQDLIDFGAVCIRTNRFTKEQNDAGLQAAQGYFSRPYEIRMLDVPPPELAFQVGLTPRGQEQTRQKYDEFTCLPPEHRPTRPLRGQAISERLMFPIGSRPAIMPERFRSLNEIHANPAGVLPFEEGLRTCGDGLVGVAFDFADLLEIGLMLGEGRIRQLCTDGPHLGAPNASHIDEDVELGDVANEVHYDLNWATFFGKANAPGLFVWIGQKYRVKLVIPDGCVLIQVGKQLEWMTGGYIRYGLHEVVVTQEMIDTLTRTTPPGRPRVRTSWPLFFHANSNEWLEPFDHFAAMAHASNYPRQLAGDYLFDELAAINLAVSSRAA